MGAPTQSFFSLDSFMIHGPWLCGLEMLSYVGKPEDSHRKYAAFEMCACGHHSSARVSPVTAASVKLLSLFPAAVCSTVESLMGIRGE